MADIKLKPCPFCGSEKLKIEKKNKKTRYHVNGNLYNYTASVRCNACHARGSTVSGWVRNRRYVEDTEWLPEEIPEQNLDESAIKEWNKRRYPI